jgi:multicomponent K+:H+ antiporter subunit D
VSHLIIVPILLPLLTGILLILLTGRRLAVIRTVSLLSSAALVLACAELLVSSISGRIEVYALGDWAPPFGIVLVLDRLSALMLMATSVLAFFSLLYAVRDNDRPGDNLHGLVHFLLLGVNGAFLTGDIFNLFVFFEILLLSSYALLLHGGGAKRAKFGLHYVVLNLAGSALFLIAVSVLYGLTGTLNMADMALKVAKLNPADAPIVATAAVLLLIVFGLKAAIVPLYFWLPRAYAAASAPVAALFAIMTKVGIYTIIRVYTLIFGDMAGPIANLVQPWLWPLALVTLSLGVIGALAARQLRVQIAYLVIVSVGTLLAGIAMNSEAALSATMYYLLHSTWICGALFLLADVIKHQRGSSSDRIVTGPSLPQASLVGSLFFVAAISVIGLPPLSGFVGKVMLLQAAETATQSFWLWGVLLIGSLVVMMALSRSGSTFFWRTEDRVAETERADPWALVAIGGLLSMSLLLTLGGDAVMRFTQALAHQIMTPDNYIHAVLTHQTLSGG